VEEIAQVYARSLFEVALENNELDQIHDQLGEFTDALDKSRELQVFFFSPYFSGEEKKDGIGKIVEDGNERFVNFLELVAERHRMPAMFRIRREFDQLWKQENRLLEVRITSAIELDDEIVRDIGERIESQTGQQIDLDANVDPDVIGGLVLRVGNIVMDASVRGRLQRLRKEVAQAA
jgi:F-type H+-transporting ATPase subunit delta